MAQNRDNQRGKMSDVGDGGDLDSRSGDIGMDDDDSRAQRSNRTGGGRQSGKVSGDKGSRRS